VLSNTSSSWCVYVAYACVHAYVRMHMRMQVLTRQYVQAPASKTDLYSLLQVHQPDLGHCCINVVLSKDGASTRPRAQRPAVRGQTTTYT
jgi:hypothetical protein